ncbi:hypothetical protein NG797_02980 [Laspinema sp. D5]|nr:hypothetical protein [Laspinema sp. D3d]
MTGERKQRRSPLVSDKWVTSRTEREKAVEACGPPGLTRAGTDQSNERFPPKIVPRKTSGGNPAIGGDDPHKAIK